MEIALGYVGIDFIAPTVPNGERERENKLVTVIFEASFFLFPSLSLFLNNFYTFERDNLLFLLFPPHEYVTLRFNRNLLFTNYYLIGCYCQIVVKSRNQQRK